jgi:hypothetical protein
MTTQVLTPTQLVKDGPGLDITALLADPTGTTLQFANTGKEVLLVSAGASAETVTVDVGVTVLGQSVTDFDAVTLTSGDLYLFGPFDSAVDQAGTNTVQVVLSTTTSITVALLQNVGVF